MWHAAVVFYADENITAAKRTQAKKKRTVKYVNGNQTAILKKTVLRVQCEMQNLWKEFFSFIYFSTNSKIEFTLYFKCEY